MKLARKLAIPQICISVCIGLIGFPAIKLSFGKMREQYVADTALTCVGFVQKAADNFSAGIDDDTGVLHTILESAKESGKTDMYFFINRESADSYFGSDAASYPVKGDFLQAFGERGGSTETLISADFLSKGQYETTFLNDGAVSLVASPFYNSRGIQTGVIVCALNAGSFLAFANTASLVLALVLAGMVAFPASALLLALRGVSRDKNTDNTPAPDALEGESEKFVALAHWYGSILDSIPYLVSVLDADMKWTFINAAMERFIGKKREEVAGLPCSEWDLRICGADNCAVAEAMRGRKQTFYNHNNSVYKVDVEILKDLKGKTTGFIEVIQDVTETELLAERHAEAHAASQAKTNFLANMSHEIRTPLNAIVGMTLVGISAADPERMKYCFVKIENASRHLLGVINDILDISKIEAGKLELSPVEFNFETMLRRVVSVIAFRIDERKQRFDVSVDRNIPQNLIGDDQRLAQVIVNLLSNAVKFTPENGVISLGARLDKSDGGFHKILFTVTDTGIGMTSEQQARLFQSFQQAEVDTTRKYGGTGLGLSISKSIVEMMGGEIWVESEMGKGSVFAFTVPMGQGESDKRKLMLSEVVLEKISILMVDDNPDILIYFKEIMQEFGINCDVVMNGEDALDILEADRHYDIIFIDWKLPGIDGIELTRRIKGNSDPKTKPAVILISATELGASETEADEAGIFKFILKPLFPSTFMDIINECLGAGIERAIEKTQNDSGIFANHCILLSEDVEINREILLSLLGPTGITIDCAENGVEAVRMFGGAPDRYEMIFMDVQMPEMDGYEATRSIRALDNACAKTVPIIAMTANVFREDVEKCLEAGMNGHVGKPISIDEVLVMLKRYIG